MRYQLLKDVFNNNFS